MMVDVNLTFCDELHRTKSLLLLLLLGEKGQEETVAISFVNQRYGAFCRDHRIRR